MIYTDQKNLKFKHFNTNRVLRWRLILGEFGQDIEYTNDEKNIVADTLSIFTINWNKETTQE